MSKMPNKVTIGTQEWDIIERSPKVDDALSDSAYGYTLPRSSTIIIDSDATLSRKRQTLWHELMHAVRFSFGSTIAPVANEDEGKLLDAWEHYFIGMYEEGLLAILRNNPKITAFLLEKDLPK
jgi:hypothetical protein